MKILVITTFYRWFVKDLVDVQAKYVDEIHVLVRHNRIAELVKLSLFSKLPFPYLNWVKYYTKETLLDLYNMPENVKAYLVSTYYLIPDGKNKGLGEKLFGLYMKYIQKKHLSFDLIHAHFIWPQGYVAAKLARKFNVPLIITAHGHDVYDIPFRDSDWFEKIKFALDSADHVITVSNSNRKILVERLGVAEEKVSVIPNGFDSSLFYPMDKVEVRQKLGLPLDKKILLNVANLVPVKGHEFLIKAMGDVLKVRRDVLLVIVGDGSLRARLDGLVKKLGLERYVKFVGAKPHKEIPLWMNAADLFVLPSLSEGNPTVMFEALGVGLPFVGTAVGGVPEIITSEDYGLLCPPADPECLAEKILISLEKEWDREKIRRYAEQFTWENIAKQILRVYEEVLK
ncbi:glycosyltransferase family 4 protein [Thermococcus waiotapuensis]|uniref:Glycosyltransferase family 4 protein n=1 Tax=Thermococcus waiotapuensis TaxID=90909 RepID=A0AAE4T2H1_9EURY|nr:glycosyltransferase family 4 protein [Thermococcus waiotapuensis]MDV3104092.1 glycosyltransferase family 4 protein [Thermococcus waiotapuensis]